MTTAVTEKELIVLCLSEAQARLPLPEHIVFLHPESFLRVSWECRTARRILHFLL